MLCSGNQPVEHGLEGAAAQLIVLVRLLLFQVCVFQVGADTVFKDAELGNGIRDAQTRRQFLFSRMAVSRVSFSSSKEVRQDASSRNRCRGGLTTVSQNSR